MDKTIQEKLTTIAENRPKIYNNGVNDGIRAGRDEIISNSKYIEKSATGKFISLTDVSEVSHKVKVFGDGDVDVYGRNLIDYTKAKARDSTSIIFNDNGLTYTGSWYFMIPVSLKGGLTYVLSYDGMTDTSRWCFAHSDNSNDVSKNVATGMSITPDRDVKYVYIYPYKESSEVATTTIRDIQLEFNAVSPYEKYKGQTITATPLGTEIPSMCPVMNFISDEDIQVDYYSSFGMNAEWSRFWDGYQNNGNRRDYSNAFAGVGWNDATFKPKYDIVVTSGSNLFLGSKITDIVKKFDECGVTLNTSNCTVFSYAMQSMTSKSFPLLDLSVCTSAPTNLFNNCQNLEYIVGIVSSEKTKFHNTSFGSCPKLTHIIFSGVIASDINLQWSKLLDDESLISLMETLKQFENTDAAWQTKTITLAPESWARLDILLDEGGVPYGTYAVGKGWNRA